jgi:hypothetical protein
MSTDLIRGHTKIRRGWKSYPDRLVHSPSFTTWTLETRYGAKWVIHFFIFTCSSVFCWICQRHVPVLHYTDIALCWSSKHCITFTPDWSRGKSGAQMLLHSCAALWSILYVVENAICKTYLSSHPETANITTRTFELPVSVRIQRVPECVVAPVTAIPNALCVNQCPTAQHSHCSGQH